MVKNRREAMFDAMEVLTEAGLRFWIGNGALLGIYRDGELIEWDNDVEFNCRTEDLKIKHRHVRKLAKRKNFTVGDYKKHKFGLLRDGENMSIAGHKLRGIYRVRKKRRVPAKFFGEGYVEYRGIRLPCHTPIEKYLKWIYADWKTPTKGKPKQYLNKKVWTK